MSTSRRIVKSILHCHRHWRWRWQRRQRRSYFMKERIYRFYSLTTFREATDQMKRFSANIGQLIFFFCIALLFFFLFSCRSLLIYSTDVTSFMSFHNFYDGIDKTCQSIGMFFFFFLIFFPYFLSFIHYDPEVKMTSFFLVKSMYFPCFLSVADFYICPFGYFKFH